MNRKIANTLVIVVIGFILFSITLGLLLSFVNFQPLVYEIKTKNTLCNFSEIDREDKDINNATILNNSLLSPNVYQEIKTAQAKRSDNLIVRDLTTYDVKFLKNCHDVIYKKALASDIEPFEKVNTLQDGPIFSNFSVLKSAFEKMRFANNIKPKVDWDKLVGNLTNSQDKILMQQEIVKFFNTFAHFYSKQTTLQLLFAIIVQNNLRPGVIGVTKTDTNALWQYMQLSERFNDKSAIATQYDSGFWSSNNITTVIVHEYGHALENYLGIPQHLRTSFNGFPNIQYPCRELKNWQYYSSFCSGAKLINQEKMFVSPIRKSVSTYLVDWLSEKAGVTETLQKRLLVWSIVNSNYGRTTNMREIFAEAWTKWLLTSKLDRDVSWVLLNKFFSEVLPQKYHATTKS